MVVLVRISKFGSTLRHCETYRENEFCTHAHLFLA